MLKFFKGNKKLNKDIYTFSLPAGYCCPFAKLCLSRANKKTGKIKDGPNIEYRCYSASTESLFKNVRKSRWRNFNLLKNKSKEEMIELILMSLPNKAKYVRIHISGDYYNQDYFDAWLMVAKIKSKVLFYSYTKCLPFWIKRLKQIPENFILTASKGGTKDKLINKYNLKYAQVVYSEKEATDLGLEIDHDDSHAMGNKSFGLLIHGSQPKSVNQRIRLLLIGTD